MIQSMDCLEIDPITHSRDEVMDSLNDRRVDLSVWWISTPMKEQWSMKPNLTLKSPAMWCQRVNINVIFSFLCVLHWKPCHLILAVQSSEPACIHGTINHQPILSRLYNGRFRNPIAHVSCRFVSTVWTVPMKVSPDSATSVFERQKRGIVARCVLS